MYVQFCKYSIWICVKKFAKPDRTNQVDIANEAGVPNNWARICKQKGAEESIPSLAESIPRNQFLAFLKVYKFGLW
jgi:hypothetical protein